MPAASFSNGKKYWVPLLLGLIIFFYLFNGIHYLRLQSVTSDEGSFMHYAIRYLKGRPERLDPVTDNSKMPVSVLNTLPRVFGDWLGSSGPKTDGGISDTMQGRYITLLVSVFTILLVFAWSRELYGEKAGLFSALLMSLCPNNLASAGLVTTDSYAVLFLLGSMYLLWKFCTTSHTRYFVYFSIVAALAQLVKQSLFHLYVLTPACILIYFLGKGQTFRWKGFLKYFFLFIAVNLLIINLGYYFHGSFTALGNYDFKSRLFLGLQQVLPAQMPLPFPGPFVEGLDMAKYYDQVGGGIPGLSSFGKVTILGQSKTGGGFWYYYLGSLFYKTPIAFLILFAWSGICLWRQRRSNAFFSREFFLLAPVLYFLLLMSFFYQTQCGIRHILFLFPFLFVFAGIIIRRLDKLPAKIFSAASLLFLLFSVTRYWGNYYPYTNEFIPDKKMAYAKVGSGNLEFHQGYQFAEKFLAKNPEVEWAPRQPKPGRFLINTEDYLDVWNRHEYDWISRYKPVDHVAYNFLLIEVDPASLTPDR